MCKINHDPVMDQVQFATFTSHMVTPCQVDRQRTLEALVNGEFLFTDYRTSVPHSILVALSTIAALSKELELDLAASGTPTTKSEVNDMAAEFGAYVYMPVMQFQSTMRRLLYSTWQRGSRHTLQRLIVKFLKLFEDVDVESKAMLILASYLWFAIYSARMYDKGRHCMPFSIDINGRGKFYLVYRYVNKKTNRPRVIRWDLKLRLPSSPSPLLSSVIKKM